MLSIIQRELEESLYSIFIDYYPASYTLQDLCDILTIPGHVPPVAIKSTNSIERQAGGGGRKFAHAAFESEKTKQAVVDKVSQLTLEGHRLTVEDASAPRPGGSMWRWNSFSAEFAKDYEKKAERGRKTNDRFRHGPSVVLSDEHVPLHLVNPFPQLWITQLPHSVHRSAILGFFESGMSRDTILGVVVGHVDTTRMVGTATIIFYSVEDRDQFCESLTLSLSLSLPLPPAADSLTRSQVVCWSGIPRSKGSAFPQTVEQARSEMGGYDSLLSRQVPRRSKAWIAETRARSRSWNEVGKRSNSTFFGARTRRFRPRLDESVSRCYRYRRFSGEEAQAGVAGWMRGI